ncbi:hypothetical protein OJAV_G00218360 [Oryzias javanicus]|uniref:Uncharacterized protein n=1 Tax=Oryzias javanicus TaxID=123683 RepID=A0A3S2TXF1_ORYJA|nr:hypothetical protein OJAV_G00218360 [Oryzias javanicus]
MDFETGRSEVLQLLSRLSPSELPKLLDWMKSSDDLDHLVDDNNKVILLSIADDLRAQLPLDAMLTSETAAHLKMQQRACPTAHVDSFLYSDEQCEEL